MNQAIIEAKKAYVAEIAEKMKNAESTVVVEYRGLTVAEMTELRRELRAEDVEFKVYKNALAQRAVESIGADGLILLLPSSEHDFKMTYYNSDGREGSFCGNGGRCITAFANNCGIQCHTHTFEAVDGIHHYNVKKMSEKDLQLFLMDR